MRNLKQRHRIITVLKKVKRGSKNKTNKGVARAIETVGSQVALARLMNVAQPAVCHWLYESIPAERAVELSRKTGIPTSEIRPDLFEM